MAKTNEFIKRLNSLGYGVYINVDAKIMDEDGWTICCVGGTKERDLEIKALAPFQLIELAVEYAKTPIDERKEEPLKYRLRHKWINSGNSGYLNVFIEKQCIIINTKEETSSMKTIFTQIEWVKWTGRTWEQLTQEFNAEVVG